jgi:spore coat protein A, manganese oxidase
MSEQFAQTPAGRGVACETPSVSAGAWRRVAVVTGLIGATAGPAAVLAPSFADTTPSPSASATPTPTPTPSPTPTPNAPSSATIIIGHNARVTGYQTPTITLAGGGSLSVVNEDNMEHTVTANDKADNKPLLNVYVDPGSTALISRASRLAPGTYKFHCSFHPQNMRGTLTIVGGSGSVHPTAQKFDQPLLVPKVLTDKHLHIPIKPAMVRVLPDGPLTKMWTYDGIYPGPTIERPAGKDTKVTFVDHLPKSDGSFTVHYHGDHHTSADDGRPTTQLIHHGQSRTYDYPGTDGGRPEPAAFNFYHDHRMGRTARNNWMGLQGMFITHDSTASKFRLPQGKYDVPLMISERDFTAGNQLTDPFPAHPSMVTKGAKAPPGDGTVGTQILADGRVAPYLNVSTHRYRLRLLNTAPFTSYDFRLSDGKPFVQVGTGDGLLPKPVVRQDILLGPAQRVDVIVDFHGELHKKIVLESVPRSDNPPPGSVGSPTASIMQFRVTKSASGDKTRIPSALVAPPAINAPKKATASWSLGLSGDPSTGSVWTVNGKPFDPARADLKVPLGSTQTWILRNVSPITHYFHLHEELWHTISRDGRKPPPWERGLEDTWKLDPGETVKVAAKFTDYTGLFMLHCHMLDHEDHGLMAQFEVVRTKSRTTSGSAAQAAVALRTVRRAQLSPTKLWGLTFIRPRLATDWPGAFGLSAADLQAMMCGPDGTSKAHAKTRRQRTRSV